MLITTSSGTPPPAGHKPELHLLFWQPHQGRIEKAQIQRAAGELLLSFLTAFLLHVCCLAFDVNVVSVLQKDPFIQMYEERSVDVAGYVCRLLDQMPASPSSPTYMD